MHDVEAIRNRLRDARSLPDLLAASFKRWLEKKYPQYHWVRVYGERPRSQSETPGDVSTPAPPLTHGAHETGGTHVGRSTC